MTAIIDGTGSLGAAIGPLVVGVITHYKVYYYYTAICLEPISLLLYRNTAIPNGCKLVINCMAPRLFVCLFVL